MKQLNDHPTQSLREELAEILENTDIPESDQELDSLISKLLSATENRLQEMVSEFDDCIAWEDIKRLLSEK